MALKEGTLQNSDVSWKTFFSVVLSKSLIVNVSEEIKNI